MTCPSPLTFRNPMKNGFTDDHRYIIVEARNVGNMVELSFLRMKEIWSFDIMLEIDVRFGS